MLHKWSSCAQSLKITILQDGLESWTGTRSPDRLNAILKAMELIKRKVRIPLFWYLVQPLETEKLVGIYPVSLPWRAHQCDQGYVRFQIKTWKNGFDHISWLYAYHRANVRVIFFRAWKLIVKLISWQLGPYGSNEICQNSNATLQMDFVWI